MEVTPSPQYLCLSHGQTIFCLKLDPSLSNNDTVIDDIYNLPNLPIICTLNLMEKGLPLLIGLAKLGSDTCVIGGYHFPSVLPSNLKLPSNLDLLSDPCNDLCPYLNLGHKSDEIKVLSLLDAGTPTLSLTKSRRIPYPRNPKMWPIVEKIEGQTHVLTSIPSQVWCARGTIKGIPSHEVFDPDCGTWSEISTTLEEVGLIKKHVVVGHRIYAMSDKKCLVFDSKAKNWEESKLSMNCFDITLDTFVLRNVFQVIHRGIGRCFGGLVYGDLRVLFALVPEKYCYATDRNLHTIAYLVTSTGRIVCFQRIPFFFKGPVWPVSIVNGRVIDVDEHGETLCSIFFGEGFDLYTTTPRLCVFINTFSAEVRSEAASKIEQVCGNGGEVPIEVEFVNVNVKSRYVYLTDWGFRLSIGFQACFL